jgi:hypothetical protein
LLHLFRIVASHQGVELLEGVDVDEHQLARESLG